MESSLQERHRRHLDGPIATVVATHPGVSIDSVVSQLSPQSSNSLVEGRQAQLRRTLHRSHLHPDCNGQHHIRPGRIRWNPLEEVCYGHPIDLPVVS